MSKKILGFISVCFIFIFLAVQCAVAQHNHFIYFQHDQSASFYVKHEGQIMRSSPQGYLILSKLNKGRQVFFVGLNEANQPLLQFVLDTLNSDRGYLIKNFSGSGWGLFDLQTSAVLKPVMDNNLPGSAEEKRKAVAPVNDAFGNMLSDVTGDSSVKYVALPEKPVIKDTIQVKKPDIPKQAEVKKTDNVAVKVPGVKRSDVKQLQKEENDSSYRYVFLVSLNNKTDTVAAEIVRNIPAVRLTDTIIQEKIVSPDTLISTVNRTLEDTLKGESGIKKEKEASGIVVASSDSIVVRQESESGAVQKAASNPCKKIASEDDFIRLRKRMAGQRTEEKMIEEAQKVFRQVCFTSAQVGQLSGLFTSDEMKYRFFDAAVRYISDLHEFPGLGNQIRDPYFRKRFDALMPNP